MAYQYYQSACPGWGQSKVRFGVPPIPNIRPRSDWSGWDYYRAHGIGADPSLYNHFMNRVREARGSEGYGQSEAKDWHRRIYGGLTDLTRALPGDIGAAAAYEAYRMRKHHRRTLYEHLRDDRERETEGLIGLAAAEASHLWQFTGRPMDTYGLREALESAALTASNIAYRVMDEGRGHRFFSGLSSRRSSDSSALAEDDYSRGYQRHRRHSSLSGAPPIVMGRAASSAYSTPYTNAIPMPGGGTPYSNPISIPGRRSPYSNPIQIPGQGSPYGGGIAASNGSYHLGVPGSYGASNYQPGFTHSNPGSYGGATVIPAGYGGVGSAYGGGGSAYGGQQYATAGYPQGQGQAYTIQGSGVPGGAVTLPSVPPGSTIIIHQPNKRSRHHSMSGYKRSHSHRRSLSSDKRVGFI